MVTVVGDRSWCALADPQPIRQSKPPASAAVVGTSLFVSLDAPLQIHDLKPIYNLFCRHTRRGSSDSTRHTIVSVPIRHRSAPEFPDGSDSLRSLDDYRYHNDKVKYATVA